MEVRHASADDAGAIAEVHVRGWQAAYRHAFPADALDALSVEKRADAWRDQLRAGAQGVVVADEDGVVGFAGFGPSREETDVGEVYAVYVDPARWGAGAGRALLARAEEELTAAGYPVATLWVLEDNPRARRFYEAAGWRLDGARKVDTYLGTEVAQVRYRKLLGADPRLRARTTAS